ncbi:MAG: alpha/beta fold hydrolase [Alphaproteobacteria bacterium]
MLKILLLTCGAACLLLALLALYGAIYTWRVNARFPAEGTFVEVAGGRVHMVAQAPADGPAPEGPAAPPVVLLHGASANLRDPMLRLGPALVEAGFPVLAFDRPGHGWSARTAPDGHDPAVQARMIRDALDKLGVERPLVVGHSWSGAVVMALLLNHGEAIAGGVTLGGATHPWPGGPSWYNSLSLMPVVGTLFRWTLVPLAGPFMLPAGIDSNFAPNDPVPDYAVRAGMPLLFRPHQFRANAEDSVYLKNAVARMSVEYGRIDTPLLVITGDADSTVSPKRHSRAVAAQVPGARLVILDGVGHMPHQVRTDRVVAEVEALAASVRSGAR